MSIRLLFNFDIYEYIQCLYVGFLRINVATWLSLVRRDFQADEGDDYARKRGRIWRYRSAFNGA